MKVPSKILLALFITAITISFILLSIRPKHDLRNIIVVGPDLNQFRGTCPKAIKDDKTKTELIKKLRSLNADAAALAVSKGSCNW
jgi:hypothetical protein